ncbi:MAG: hypothetical protein GF383_02335 [Candidatus Lokiarchaeota archaeon]|nr:hypothetical protein [Candidatus Lokiarchaeota archaeon]MBD3338247.1 hypothetical protein [Candidatus Lokiarchaeota archaeon]
MYEWLCGRLIKPDPGILGNIQGFRRTKNIATEWRKRWDRSIPSRKNLQDAGL